MTIIVANRECMSADSKVTDDEICYYTDKIFVIGQYIVGVAGDGDPTNQFLEWFRAGKPRTTAFTGDTANFRALALSTEGLFYYCGSFLPDKLHDQHYAIGSGSHVALAALLLGQDPQGAATLACNLVASCGGPVKTLYLKDIKPTRKRV